jgi:HD-GYP domain-containing protein (c-di-GMP phosphodiesterase class II)
MSVTAKMMVIADVFEALTASDRPYKKAKKLSDAVHIMGMMQKGGHFDPDLYRLFLTSGIYRKYGEHYLDPDQVDEVDISQYLEISGS